MPEPEANAPPDATRSEGTETEEPEPPGGAAPPPVPAPAPVATMEAEARRIFGRPRLGQTGAGPRAVRPLEVLVPEDPEKCTPRPAALADSAPRFGLVTGRIFRQDDGRPLGGAHLQMLGTPYVSFTDDQGEYQFRFDLSLVDNCRTQYVRVSAPGYESRLLVLVVGQNIMSEDVLLRRR